MDDLFVVFYRCMNLGHRGSPTRILLESALTAAGAQRVSSFQTNGTVVFEAAGPAEAYRIVAEAGVALQEDCGYRDAAFVRSLARIVDIVADAPRQTVRDERTYGEMITVFDGGARWEHGLPWTNAKDTVDFVEIHPDYALSVVRRRGSGVGSPTSELESRLGVPATSRTMGTMTRMVKAFGPARSFQRRTNA